MRERKVPLSVRHITKWEGNKEEKNDENKIKEIYGDNPLAWMMTSLNIGDAKSSPRNTVALQQSRDSLHQLFIFIRVCIFISKSMRMCVPLCLWISVYLYVYICMRICTWDIYIYIIHRLDRKKWLVKSPFLGKCGTSFRYAEKITVPRRSLVTDCTFESPRMRKPHRACVLCFVLMRDLLRMCTVLCTNARSSTHALLFFCTFSTQSCVRVLRNSA